MSQQTALPGMAAPTQEQPKPATVYLEVDGQPHPARDCHWIEIGACGCISGCSAAATAGEVHTTGPDAFRWDSPKVVHDYYLANSGSTYKLITHQQLKDTYSAQMQSECTHTPKYGIPPIPVPDGWTWMTTDRFGSRLSYRKHIVPAEKPNDMEPMTALCGKAEKAWRWQGDRHDLYDTIPCANCVKRANDTSPALPVVDVSAGDLL